jgi:hypothetical protein
MMHSGDVRGIVNFRQQVHSDAGKGVVVVLQISDALIEAFRVTA